MHLDVIELENGEYGMVMLSFINVLPYEKQPYQIKGPMETLAIVECKHRG